MLKYRLISSFFLAFTAIAILFLLSPVGFATATLTVCILAGWEWGKIGYFKPVTQLLWMITLCVLLITIMFFLLSEYNYCIHQFLFSGLLCSIIWWFVALILVLFYPKSAILWRNFRPLYLVFGLFIILPFFFGMLALRSWQYEDSRYNGITWILYAMVLVWGTDSGSFLFGKLFGRHKLAPRISPYKTWQGFIGGLFITTVISWVYNIWMNLRLTSNIVLMYSFSSGLASILGDMTESMFKREAGIKDSGYIIPGHGGILDRIDSLTAAIPIFALLFSIFSKI